MGWKLTGDEEYQIQEHIAVYWQGASGGDILGYGINAGAVAQAKKVLKWLDEQCTEHWDEVVITSRWNCGQCIHELYRQAGL